MPGPKKYRLPFITVSGFLSEQLVTVRTRQNWQSWRPQDVDLPLADGPGSPRVCIRMYDADGNERPPVPVKSVTNTDRFIEFDLKVDGQEDPTRLRQVSVFTTIMKTLSLFEAEDILARPVPWRIDGDVLDVHLDVDDPLGASYDRRAGKITFGCFESRRHPGNKVFTSGCPDIVAHETAHGILDALAPDLYDGIDPQSSAVHEAVADLTAMFVALEMDSLREHILESSDGDLRGENAFGWIAEEYGAETDDTDSARSLRSLYSGASFVPGSDNFVKARASAYAHSVVFSSAYYTALIDEYEALRDAAPDRSTGYALYRAAVKFRRALACALDYLPPSNAITLLDLCRAIVLSDEYAFPKDRDAGLRRRLAERFAERGLCIEEDLRAPPVAPYAMFEGQDLAALAASPESIVPLLDARRDDLGIPSNASLEVSARIVTKTRWLGPGQKEPLTEAIIKYAWSSYERIELTNGKRRRLDVKIGTTLVVDPHTGEVKLVLTTYRKRDGSQVSFADERSSAQRAFVLGLLDSERLVDASDWSESRRRGLGEPYFEDDGETIRVRNVGHGLHARPVDTAD